MRFVRWFKEVGIDEVPLVGGKNASLGEMVRELGRLGVRVPDGFAVTAEGYRHFLHANGLGAPIREQLLELNPHDPDDLTRRTRLIRSLILRASLPEDLEGEIVQAYRELSRQARVEDLMVAVRSSATAEDLPTASFAGQHESYLGIQGEAELLDAVKKCFASLYTARATRYRVDMGFPHEKVLLSVGVQRLVRSDLASSGVIFTLDTETGFDGVVMLEGVWGLGENIVQGKATPDRFYVHKETLAKGYKPLLWKKLGAKELRLVYDTEHHKLRNNPVAPADRNRWVLSNDEVLELAQWAVWIEQHYSQKRGTPTPMDIEWAKDGITGELFIVQARPETVHSRKSPTIQTYTLEQEGRVLVEGLAVGEKIATGPAKVIRDPKAMNQIKPGDVLVTLTTNPDWEPIMKIASAIVTERGGRTSHAAIVARELGIPAVVGAAGATKTLARGGPVTVSCAQGEVGRVYEGALKFSVEAFDPYQVGTTRTQIMMNVGNPEQAFRLALLPNDGVGLARMEFIFADWVGIHPLALLHPEKLSPKVRREIEARTNGYSSGREYFIDRLSQGIAVLAAAFYPKPVILRMSDFKTNEYAKLLGGEAFEPGEENPMLGWRGASRYYHPDYKEGFLLEVAAVKRVRDEMGLTNLVVMIPFCRTVEEGQRVLEVMKEGGLERGKNGLEVYVMAEIPSNVILAEAFSQIFDGFSIGSNDLTQLVLGVDRDSTQVAALFDERNQAVKWACAELIQKAHKHGRKVGICGQAPSDYPEFAAFLVEAGIDSISLNPDSVVRTKKRIVETEKALGKRAGRRAR
ncbi:phosphoenolpyruvate synthase [Meiothermus sp. CFH 77666]|uniref:phosphoenolpyruvate synthase n=1 Tax=Meiothermus sp. CFH 77666 TaxID=2817942 RepID=UPI001AA02C86|nr:phosphoenolpyruvate synthase [Meiothermus sp. CFH 77666]MBO1437314.1 phosphoenolpyruvate synthase [Meiothermus sp. CFH 77666]